MELISPKARAMRTAATDDPDAYPDAEPGERRRSVVEQGAPLLAAELEVEPAERA